jgi:hypothetical protein
MNFNMKKNIATFSLLYASLSGATQRNFIEPSNIAGTGIDSCVMFRCDANDTLKTATYHYNSNGSVNNRILHYNEDNFSEIKTYSYNDPGKLVQIVTLDISHFLYSPYDTLYLWQKNWYWESAMGKTHEKQVFEYDSLGRTATVYKYSAMFSMDSLTKVHLKQSEKYYYNATGDIIIQVTCQHKDYGKPTCDSILRKFDVKGNMTEQTVYAGYQGDQRCSYDYDANGMVVKKEIYYPQSADTIIFVYAYDSLHNCLSMKRYESGDGLVSAERFAYQDTLLIYEGYVGQNNAYITDDYYSYDSLGRVIHHENIVLRGSGYVVHHGPNYKKVYAYDSYGNIVEETQYEKDVSAKNFRGRSEYFYNEKQQVIREKSYNRDNELNRIELKEYDSLGHAFKIIKFNKDSIYQSTEIHIFDSSGVRISRKMWNQKGELELYQTYRYENGVEVGGVFFRQGRRSLTKEYYYNADGTYDYVRFIEKDWLLTSRVTPPPIPIHPIKRHQAILRNIFNEPLRCQYSRIAIIGNFSAAIYGNNLMIQNENENENENENQENCSP